MLSDLSEMARSGIRLDDETISKIAKEQAKEQQRGGWLKILAAAIAAAAIVVVLSKLSVISLR